MAKVFLGIRSDTTLYVNQQSDDVKNLAYYGFVGDGSDESVAFTDFLATLTGKETIYIPRGFILGSSGEHELPIGVNVKGEGTIIKLDRGTASHHLLTCLGNNNVEGVTFDGNRDALTNADRRSQVDLQVQGPNVTVERCHFSDSGGSSISGSSGIDGFWCEKCTFNEFDDHAIYFSNEAVNIFVSENKITSLTGYAALKLRGDNSKKIGQASYTNNLIESTFRPFELGTNTVDMLDVVITGNMIYQDHGLMAGSQSGNFVDGLIYSGNHIAPYTTDVLTTSIFEMQHSEGGCAAKNWSVCDNKIDGFHLFNVAAKDGYTDLVGMQIAGNTLLVTDDTVQTIHFVYANNCSEVCIADNSWYGAVGVTGRIEAVEGTSEVLVTNNKFYRTTISVSGPVTMDNNYTDGQPA